MPSKRGRHPKKAGGRATPKGTQPSGHVSPQVRAIFANAAEVIREDPADAEGFASSFQQVFRVEGQSRSLASPEEVLREALRVGGLVGLFVANSIRIFGPHGARARAELVYDKLVAKTPPPRWLAEMGNVPVARLRCAAISRATLRCVSRIRRSTRHTVGRVTSMPKWVASPRFTTAATALVASAAASRRSRWRTTRPKRARGSKPVRSLDRIRIELSKTSTT